MAKKAMLEREKKRKKLVIKYSEKRMSFLKELKQVQSLEDIFKINEKIVSPNEPRKIKKLSD